MKPQHTPTKVEAKAKVEPPPVPEKKGLGIADAAIAEAQAEAGKAMRQRMDEMFADMRCSMANTIASVAGTPPPNEEQTEADEQRNDELFAAWARGWKQAVVITGVALLVIFAVFWPEPPPQVGVFAEPVKKEVVFE